MPQPRITDAMKLRAPEGKGLLGKLIDEPVPVRLANIAESPDAAGFPPGHPPMTTFLGVPVRSKGRIFGNLYLANKAGGVEFTDTR